MNLNKRVFSSLAVATLISANLSCSVYAFENDVKLTSVTEKQCLAYQKESDKDNNYIRANDKNRDECKRKLSDYLNFKTRLFCSYKSKPQYADYNSIEFTGCLGSTIILSIDGDELKAESDNSESVSLKVTNKKGEVLGETEGTSQINLNVFSKIDKNIKYKVIFEYRLDGETSVFEDIYVTKSTKEELFFVKPSMYDENVDKYNELSNDDTYLNECLETQNDIDCDNQIVKNFADNLVQGANTDFEKAHLIYRYVIENMYYNYDLIKSFDYVYQDSALTLIRNNYGVCEGFSNVFVTLCRALNIPATVSFGRRDDNRSYAEEESDATDHAWVSVYLGGKWYFLDPTWDDENIYYHKHKAKGDNTFNWYLVPIEVFSFTHTVVDVDIKHCNSISGSCGDNATYTIDNRGVLTISGSGEICLPSEARGATSVVFDKESSITSIGKEAFLNCDMLKSIKLPDTVKTIRKEAFCSCEDLRYIYIPNGVIMIEEGAFSYCSELSYVSVPETVKTIGNFAFDYCPRLVLSVPSAIADKFEYDKYKVGFFALDIRE